MGAENGGGYSGGSMRNRLSGARCTGRWPLRV